MPINLYPNIVQDIDFLATRLNDQASLLQIDHERFSLIALRLNKIICWST